MGLRIIAGSHKKYGCGLYTRGVKARLRYPSIESESQACIGFLEDYLKREKVDVLIPVGDVMTDRIAAQQDHLRAHTRLVLPDYNNFQCARDKIGTMKAALQAGCPIPQTWYPHENGLEQVIDEITFPVLVKPAISAGARGIKFCHDADDIRKHYEWATANFGVSYVQEFVPQTGLQYKVDAVFGYQQELLAAVAYAKLRYYPADGGSSVLNRTEWRPDIIDNATKVMKSLQWIGICDFDFITDPRDQVVKLIEINPRFPESYRATVAGGVDMTKVLIQLALGETPQPQLDYTEGRYTRFLFGDLMWFMTVGPQRWKAKPSFFSFCRRDTNYQLLRLWDYGPIFGYIMENLLLMMDGHSRRKRFRLKRNG